MPNTCNNQLATPQPEPITGSQLAYLAKLKTAVGQRTYQAIKRKMQLAGRLPADFTKAQASGFIRQLIKAKTYPKRYKGKGADDAN